MTTTTLPDQHHAMGLVARLERSLIRLPLKAIEIEAEISGDLVSVETEQLFLQDSPEPLDCSYTFPLPADAAVYRCEMHIGDRVIEAKVLERDEARRVFEQRKSEGRRAALANMDRENLFNLDLGNLQPGDLIRVRFAYVQRLDRLDDLRTLRVPLTPGIRYVPGRPLRRANVGTGTSDDTNQVPDASRVTPPRIDALHPDAAAFHARVRIDEARGALEALRSTSHKVQVTGEAASTVVRVAGDDEIPDRDFLLTWRVRPAIATSARAWTVTRDGIPYALLEMHGGPLPADAEPESRDVYVLLDRSGSMSGAPWEAACQAMASFAKALPASTRIDLTLFESNFTHFTKQPVPASAFLKQAGRDASRLIPLGVAGGTELVPALDAVFARRDRFSSGRPAVLLLLTDGMVANERALLDRARRSETTIHLVGIGLAPNDALRSVAEATGGQAVFAPPHEDLDPLVSRFASRLSKPVLEELTLPPGWTSADEAGLRALYPLEQRLVVLRGEPGSRCSSLTALRDGRTGELAIESVPVENSAIPHLWARDRIRFLEQACRTDEALQVARDFNLASSQTSFVAWDPEEQVAVAGRHLHQPSLDLAPMTRPSENSPRFAVRSDHDDVLGEVDDVLGEVADDPSYDYLRQYEAHFEVSESHSPLGSSRFRKNRRSPDRQERPGFMKRRKRSRSVPSVPESPDWTDRKPSRSSAAPSGRRGLFPWIRILLAKLARFLARIFRRSTS